MVNFNTQKKIIISFFSILFGTQVLQPVFANADTTSSPIISVVPGGTNKETITITFTDPVTPGNIIDLELYDNSNNKMWQAYTDKGGTTFSTVTSELPNGTYALKGGLFSPNWQTTTSWFSNLTTLTIPNTSQIIPTPSITPSPEISSATSPNETQTVTTSSDQSSILNTAMNAYQDWKKRFVVTSDGGSLRVIRPENNNDTVSEGIGYGMLLSVFAKDKQTFDGLFAYAKKYFDERELMNWDISATGSVIGTGSATDADEDMAYALTKANTIWSGNSYSDDANHLIMSIKKTEVTSENFINPGDNWGNTQVMDPSYIAPSYYRIFAQTTGDTQWNTIAQVNSAWMAKAANSSTGLLPDWINADLSPASNNFDQHQHDFWYDAIRTPIRLLMTYIADKDPNAQMILQKQAAFYNGIGVSKLLSGYTLSGSPLTNYLDTTFISGYTAAGQIDPSSSYAKSMVAKLLNQNPDGYFGTSLRALTLFILARSS